MGDDCNIPKKIFIFNICPRINNEISQGVQEHFQKICSFGKYIPKLATPTKYYTLICYLTESGDVGSSRWESLKEEDERDGRTGGGVRGGGGHSCGQIPLMGTDPPHIRPTSLSV